MPNFIPKFRYRIRHRKNSRFTDCLKVQTETLVPFIHVSCFLIRSISNLLAIDANRLLVDFLSLIYPE